MASLRQYAGLLKLKYTIYMSMCADFISKKRKKSSHHFDLTLNSYKFITHFNLLNSSNKYVNVISTNIHINIYTQYSIYT